MVGEQPGLPEEGAEGPKYEPGDQRPMENDPSRYYETGPLRVAVGKDGLPVIQGELPEGPGPHLDDDNLVCEAAPGRERCVHLRGIVTGAPGVARGFDKLYRIRRFCTKLATATELMDLEGTEVYACITRDPPDPVSAKKWGSIEAKQKQAARDAAQTSGELDF